MRGDANKRKREGSRRAGRAGEPGGGRTPRHATRLKTLRPRLIDLLKEMESHEARASKAESPAYDFGWMWRELGLE